MIWATVSSRLSVCWLYTASSSSATKNVISLISVLGIWWCPCVKVHLVKAMVFPAVMYGCELNCEESRALKNWCFWTMVLEKTLESPLDCKEIQPVHSKDQFWVFFGRTDAKAETPMLWPSHAKSWLLGKDSDAGRDWGQEEKGTRGWDGWMASPTQWTWVWASSGSWWWTEKIGVLQSMGLQKVGHNWVTEMNHIQTQILGQGIRRKWFKQHKATLLSSAVREGTHTRLHFPK